MAIGPINVSRVSQNMRTNFAIGTLQQNQLDLFATQSRIASGRSFATPSENPVAAARVLDLTQAMQRQEQFTANLRHGDNVLAAADDAITEINSLLVEAQTIASKNVSNLVSADERRADAELIAGIRRQLQAVGNRLFDGRYLFAGRDTTESPFVEVLGGVAYTGDTGYLLTRVNEDASAAINMPGNVLFGALSHRIATDADLTPVLTASTRLDEVGGATGQGIRAGSLVISDESAGIFSVDLSSADTVGDIVESINAAAESAGSRLTAQISTIGIDITPGGAAVSIGDTSGGTVAADLGILTNTPTTDRIVGEDLAPRLTRLTPVEELMGGVGIDLDGGLIVTNGPRTVTVDLSTAETVQDIINTINNSDVFVLARINEAGTGIDLFNQVSGTSLMIGENGGTTAAALGIRTYDASTPLESLNFGRGLNLTEGLDDLRITAQDGSTFDVNLDDAATVGDVIDLLGAAAAAAGVSVDASLSEVGNGIRLVDGSGGSGVLTVSPLNQSSAADGLGLIVPMDAGATELVGEDRNPTRTDGIFSALVELESALSTDNTQEIALAAERLGPLTEEVTRNHGIIGAQSQSMRSQLNQMQNAAATSEVFLSEVRDLDYAEAVTRLQQSMTQLQVSMQVNAQLLSLSLMDFLT